LGASAIGVAWDGFAPFLRRIRIDPAPVLQVPARALRNLVPLVRQDLVRFLHSTDRKLHVWTVDDRDQMEQLLDLGVDGLISNDLVLLKHVLQERGLWRVDQ
ncbi:MAG: glycerophosphodiester phosphodiesterase family protein, partial [Propionicimonas sp.]